jgi:hypothetical protein
MIGDREAFLVVPSRSRVAAPVARQALGKILAVSGIS